MRSSSFLERVSHDREWRLKVREIELKEEAEKRASRDLELREYEANKNIWKNPAFISMFGVVLAALITGWINIYIMSNNGEQAIRVEQVKAESAIVLEAVKTSDPDKAAENLKFLTNIGLISSDKVRESIVKYINERQSGEGISLPAAASVGIPNKPTFDVELAKLHPDLRNKIRELISRAAAQNIEVTLFEGFRGPRAHLAFQEQRRAAGVAVPMGHPWENMRSFGLLATVTAQSTSSTKQSTMQTTSTVQQIAAEVGLRFRGPREPLTFMLPGVVMADLQSGRYPPGGDEAWASNLRAVILDWAREYPDTAPPLP